MHSGRELWNIKILIVSDCEKRFLMLQFLHEKQNGRNCQNSIVI